MEGDPKSLFQKLRRLTSDGGGSGIESMKLEPARVARMTANRAAASAPNTVSLRAYGSDAIGKLRCKKAV